MFTRFQALSQSHLFDAPLIKIPPSTEGAQFLAALGGAYEFEEEQLRSHLIQAATELRLSLQQPDLQGGRGVPEFVTSLSAVLDFLNSVDDATVLLYSFDSAPSIDDVLEAFASGAGANDWALEEIGNKGTEGRQLLLSALQQQLPKDRLLAAVSMLLILFRDEATIAEAKRFAHSCAPEIANEVAQLVAAYTSI
ncbi:MAG: hypothetical protein JWP89_2895 [Schlesneria sp.]|nr:hypothetical protein [Schlesneria sp.]